MDNIQWIKDLVLAEQEMEESGMIDVSAGFDSEKILSEETVSYLRDLKTAFVESASAFNQLKGSTLGNIKIYGISKTRADFMLFRNGHKMIFSMFRPGVVHVHEGQLNNSFIPGAEDKKDGDKDSLKAQWGAFGELTWKYNDQDVKIDNIVRFYTSKFVRESTK